MPLTDYDFSKTLQATSFNDSGNTIDKAQPVILRGNDYTGVDGFESGSSQLDWESGSGFTIDANAEMYLNESLQVSSNNQELVEGRSLTESFNTDGKKVVGSIKIDNQTENSNDEISFTLSGPDSAGVTGSIINVVFRGNGDVEHNGTVVDSWTTGTVYDVEIEVDFTNQESTLTLNDSIVDSNRGFVYSAGLVEPVDAVNEITLENDTSASGSTVNAFFDRLTYTAPVEDSINAGGFIGYDSSTVAGPEDVAFYDQNDNLLDYELENPGDLGSSSAEVTAWVYNSYTRDDSDQVKFAFGDNSANTDRQNVTGTWNNSGQNAWGIMHQATGELGFDSAQGITRTVTGVTEATGQFDGGGNYDGTDDEIHFEGDQGTGDTTLKIWFKQGTNNDFDSLLHVSGSNDDVFRINGNDDGTVNANMFDSSTGSNEKTPKSSQVDDDKWHQAVAVIRANNNLELFVDGNSVGTSSTSNNPDLSGERGNRLSRLGSRDSGRFYEGELDEAALHTDAKDATWVQADYDASPKAGQVFFTQDAAQSTVTATEATATKYSASYSSLTPNVIVSKTATGTKYSGTYSTLQADSISNATSTVNKYAGTYSSQTASTSFSATIQATKYTATYSSQTAATKTIEVAPATKYTATYTANTAETALPITANATKYSANYSSQTATTVQILSAAANKYSASYSSRTADTFSTTITPVTKYSADYSTRQASTTFDATTNATKYSASYTSQTAATLVKQMAEADKYNLTYSSKTATAKILVSGPDVTYPLFVNEESMRKRIKDQ